ncbi:MAG: exopolysaccharide biosynthesis polyprenyl glycosylphosphotransferase, partial [Burkholderiales bacterium]
SQTGQRVYENSYTRRVSLPVVGTGEALEEILSRLQITHVILAEGESAQKKFQQIADSCEKYGVRISFVPLQYRLNQHSLYYLDLDGLMLAEIRPVEESNVYRVTKRFLDLALGGALLLLTLPLMALIAVAILMTGGRPVIFAHDRVGQFGRVFRLYKFRIMRSDAEAYAPTPKTYADGRITPLGRFLRRTSLDELPQLFNVLRGQMSLVGPRPEMPFIVKQYTPLQRERLLAKPGITGLWQISADRAFEIHENIDYDLYYIRNRSLSLDVVILLHTVIFVLRGVGAY